MLYIYSDLVTLVWFIYIAIWLLWYGMVWYGMVWYGMVWYGMVWYGMVWYVGYGSVYDICYMQYSVAVMFYGMVCRGLVTYTVYDMVYAWYMHVCGTAI